MSEGKNVKIKLKVAGVEVELECDESQVEKAVQDILKGMKATQSITGGLRPSIPIEAMPKTCKEVVEELWREEWFSESRTLSEVWEELGRRGYHYDRSAVSHALLDLTKEGIMSRQGKARKYRYIQKTPRRVEVSNIHPNFDG